MTNFILNNQEVKNTNIGDFNGDKIPDDFFEVYIMDFQNLILSNNEEFNFLILDQLPNGF